MEKANVERLGALRSPGDPALDELSAKVLAAFQADFEAQGIRYLFFSFGSRLDREPAEGAHFDGLTRQGERALREAGVETLGFEDRFRRGRPRGKAFAHLYYPQDHHPNQAGYAELTQVLFDELVQRSWCDPTSE